MTIYVYLWLLLLAMGYSFFYLVKHPHTSSTTTILLFYCVFIPFFPLLLQKKNTLSHFSSACVSTIQLSEKAPCSWVRDGGSRPSPATTPSLGTRMLIKIPPPHLLFSVLSHVRGQRRHQTIVPSRQRLPQPLVFGQARNPTACYLVGNGQVVNPQTQKKEGLHRD